ncbi:MAG: dihydrodipicolinate synthase family protein [Verrucomicrobiales bacterium]|nr:dihydrodipicolinate synthase family protein [Verrucomicrobiales bacterium]
MKNLKGIVPPLITPLKDRDHLDHEGLERLVDHVITGGVSGIFILGTTGEAPSLSYALRRELIKKVCQQAAGRVPVLVGITDTAFVESVNLAKTAADCGADALVLTTPYYFPAGQTELSEYVSHLVPELPLPLMLYNMPALTKVWFEVETLRALSDNEKIVGVKDSSGDLEYFGDLVSLRKERPDWTFFVGPEHLLVDAVRLGADGGVNGGANVFPRLFVDTYQAAVENDTEKIATLQATIEALQGIYDIGKYASRHIKATKCALSLLGICDDFMAEPFNRFNPPERKRVEEIIQKLQKTM